MRKDEQKENLKEIFSLLIEDEKEKKLANGNRSRVSGKSHMRTPVDFLTGKEKEEYMKNGEVVVYNMKYDDLKYEEFKLLEKEEKKKAFLYLCDVFKGNFDDIAKHLGCAKKKIYDIRYTLGITEKNVNYKRKNMKKADTKVDVKADIKVDTKVNEVKVERKVVSTFTLNFETSGENLKARLEGLLKMVGDDGTYSLNLEFKEYEK